MFLICRARLKDGRECRTITDADPTVIITQIDGRGAYDHIKRAAISGALARTPSAHRLLPFVRLSYGQRSRYLWRDDVGRLDEIVQGEGGEQGGDGEA